MAHRHARYEQCMVWSACAGSIAFSATVDSFDEVDHYYGTQSPWDGARADGRRCAAGLLGRVGRHESQPHGDHPGA